MMPTPYDIFRQPQRLLSYFVSPEPPLINTQRFEKGVSFDIPISHDEYPYFTAYLKSAIESLPSFVGGEMAAVQWSGTKFEVSWDEQQDSFFSREKEKPNFNPELMRTVVDSLERAERQLEKKENHIRDLESELEILRGRISRVDTFKGDPKLLMNKEEWAAKASLAIEKPLHDVQTQIMKLGDYMARAQQLVTLLSSFGKKNLHMIEAMRRMDWERIRTEYPMVIQEGIDNIQNMKRVVHELDLELPKEESKEENRTQMNLNTVVEQAIQSARLHIPKRVEIDTMLFLDRPVEVFPEQMRNAITRVLANAADRIKKDGKIRVVTRPKGDRAEIEITDNGRSLRSSLLEKEGGLGVADSIVKMHHGNMTYLKGVDFGTTCLIDLPMEFSQKSI
jgi:signal transduction histidine kinase